MSNFVSSWQKTRHSSQGWPNTSNLSVSASKELELTVYHYFWQIKWLSFLLPLLPEHWDYWYWAPHLAPFIFFNLNYFLRAHNPLYIEECDFFFDHSLSSFKYKCTYCLLIYCGCAVYACVFAHMWGHECVGVLRCSHHGASVLMLPLLTGHLNSPSRYFTTAFPQPQSSKYLVEFFEYYRFTNI